MHRNCGLVSYVKIPIYIACKRCIRRFYLDLSAGLGAGMEGNVLFLK